MPPETKCEIVFVSGDKNIDAFTNYHSEMPFAALPFHEQKISAAINEKFECSGIPMLVLLNAKTGEEITKEGRSVVTKHGPKFVSEALALVEKKKAAIQKVKTLSIFENAVVAKDGRNKMQDLQSADIIAVAFGNLTNRGWRDYVKKTLVQSYENLIKTGKKFQVVYHSESTSETANDVEDGWGFLPNGVGVEHFSAISDVSPPTVMIIGKNEDTGYFDVLVENAARMIYEMKDQAYPWTKDAVRKEQARAAERLSKQKERVNNFQILKDENVKIVDGNGEAVDIQEMQANADVIGLYFSAHWCGPCRRFTPKLAELYNVCKAEGKKFTVVFISSDTDQEAFDEYFQEMPWYALEYQNRELKETLSNIFDVQGIPTLVLLESDGTKMVTAGRDIVSVGAEYFPWGKEEMKAGNKAAKLKAEQKQKEALEKEKAFYAQIEANKEKVFRRISGTPGVSSIERSFPNIYDIEFAQFDTFATDESHDSGRIYYEIEYLSGGGILQGGFGDASFEIKHRGAGVGDDDHSWGFDGNRVCKWGNSGDAKYGKKWKHGDVIGCLADLDEKKIEFFLNGESMGTAFENIKVNGKMRIAVTAQGQKLRINVGSQMKFSRW
jgi:nucleoredoxin